MEGGRDVYLDDTRLLINSTAANGQVSMNERCESPEIDPRTLDLLLMKKEGKKEGKKDTAKGGCHLFAC